MKIINIKELEKIDAGSQPLFTGGKVTTQTVLEEELGTERLQIVNVMFAKGARNRFHTHTRKQILVVTGRKRVYYNSRHGGYNTGRRNTLARSCRGLIFCPSKHHRPATGNGNNRLMRNGANA